MDKYGTIHERITQLVDTFGKGKNTTFASLIGSNEANVRGYKTSVMPKFDFLEKIARCLDIDLKWLLTGEGSMLREDEVQRPIQPTSATSDAVSLRLMDRLEEKDVKIDQLQSELRTMEKELAVFKSKHEHNYEHPPLTEVFTGDSSKVYGKDLAPMTKPTPSKRSSAGKI